MLTIFTTAKPFRGHIGIIQRNALQSWKALHPGIEIILFGADEGAAEAAREFGLRHEPHVERNEWGSKRLDFMFARAEAIARHGILCYINCDIVLMQDFWRAIERVRAVHRESMCLPEEKPSMLLREEPRQEDQSLTNVACYPSEGSLVKMLYRAGFGMVYRVMPLPDHEDFRETTEHARRRTVLLASPAAIDVAGFRLIPEPHEAEDPWAKRPGVTATLRQRIRRFVASPARRKYITLASRARRVFPGMPIPLRLPFGAWWLAEKSALDHELIYNEFERMETGFVERLLRPGMTVVDVGAHHGLYTLLASKRVGREGRVIAFEPSPRECRRLEKHLRWNRCSNVQLMPCALGEEAGEADLFLVEGSQDWCNSLRPPTVDEPTKTVRVSVQRLDDALAELDVSKVDFIKVDAEGAELSVFVRRDAAIAEKVAASDSRGSAAQTGRVVGRLGR